MPAEYEVRPRREKRGFDLISDVLPFGLLWYDGPSAIENAMGYTKHCSRAHGAIIYVYSEAGQIIATLEYVGSFREP